MQLGCMELGHLKQGAEMLMLEVHLIHCGGEGHCHLPDNFHQHPQTPEARTSCDLHPSRLNWTFASQP